MINNDLLKSDQGSNESILLQLNNVEVIYDHVILVLKGVSFNVPKGSIVALLGANGAGKSTTLKAVSNLLRAERGEVTKGSIEYLGERIDRLTCNDLVKKGVIQVMEGRHCFEHLSVEENLLTGAYTSKSSRAEIAQQLEKTYHYFPRLKMRRKISAGYTSGGEQQMTSIGRALMANPKMILLDEPCAGLSKSETENMISVISNLARSSKATFIIVEHDMQVVELLSDHVFVMHQGKLLAEGSLNQIRDNKEVQRIYAGGSK